MPDRIILNITPQPYLKVNPTETVLFRVPERCTYIPSLGRHRQKFEDGTYEEVDVRLLGCELYNNTGFCRHTLSHKSRRRKKRITKYNEYKKELKRLATEAGFVLQPCGWSLYFYLPMAKSWKKKRRKLMHGQLKTTRPDLDNFAKGIFDSLGRKRGGDMSEPDDEIVAQLSAIGKFWIDADEGYIEILLNQPVYNPFGVTFIKQ